MAERSWRRVRGRDRAARDRAGRDSAARDRAASERTARDRAVSPVVGKAMEASIVVLFIALLSATLYGGVVPEYRTAAGAEVGERVLAESAQRVHQAVPADARRVAVRQRVTLPDTVRGAGYSVRVADRSLVLDHPDDGVGGRVALALPPTVDSVTGSWSSHEQAVVLVRTSADGDGLAVRLESSDPENGDGTRPGEGGSDR